MLALLLATSAIVVAAAIVAWQLGTRGIAAFFLAVALLSQGLLIVTVGFAGLVLRTFSPSVLVVLALAWLGLALVGAWRRRAVRPLPPVAWDTVVARLRGLARHPLVGIAAILVIGTIAWRAFLLVRVPVVDYDGWSYHLVFVDVWLQADGLVTVPHRPWTAGYPAATELLVLWVMAFTRTDALAGLPALVAIPVVAVAGAGLARSLGARREHAVLAGLLLGMTPALVAQSGTSYVDGTGLAAVVAAWWLGMRFIRGERDVGTALLLGVAAGLAFGTKATNVLLVAPVVAWAGLAWARDMAPQRAPLGRSLPTLLALGLPLFVLGAAWYLKNLALYGNPVYPFALGPFPGPVRASGLWWSPPQLSDLPLVGQVVGSWLYDWQREWYPYNVRPGGFGRVWIPALVVGLVGVAVVARRRKPLEALALIALPAVVTLAVAPNPWFARYTLFLPAAALAFGAVALSRWPKPVATGVGAVLLVLASVSLVHANLRPNVDVRAAVDGRSWARPRQYLRYLAMDPERRADVSLRRSCAEFGTIPTGARVAPGGFNLLHGVVGPELNRVLTGPLSMTRDPAELARAMRERDTEWLVTLVGVGLDETAAQAPELFRDHGEVCEGGRLWQLRPTAARP